MQSEREAKVFDDQQEDPRTRLQALFGGELPDTGQPPKSAMAWARVVLTGCPNTPAAVRWLRRAEPRLSIHAAHYLAEHALQH